MLLVFVERDRGRLVETALEAVDLAVDVAAQQAGVAVEAVVFGAADPELLDVLGARGVTVVHELVDDLLWDFAPEAWAAAIGELLGRLGPQGLLASGTERGNEVLAHVAARGDLPLATFCTAVSAGEDWEVERLRWGGMLLEHARLRAPVKLVTVAPHVGGALTGAVRGVPAVQREVVAVPAAAARSRLRERSAGTATVTLASAPVVVSGGRGVGSAEGFEALEELAALTGGVVGCSRVATSNGWRPHADQVGQTGTRVAPELYIACGISGATQHWVGCMNAANILAINTDAEAPMVTRATYAVLGDLHEVLPAVVAEIRRRVDARTRRAEVTPASG